LSKSELFDFTGKILHETPGAYLINHGKPDPVWIPKSVCEVEKNTDGKTYTVTVPQSWAEEKGIV
jgi:hypothetical protein